MAAVSLAVVGPVTLRRGAAPVPLGRKAQLLLALLAIAGPAGRDRSELAALLWEESSGPDARNALRQCLHQLRKACEGQELLAAAGERLRIDAAQCDVDLWRLQERGALDALNVYAGPLGQGLCGGDAANRVLETGRDLLRGRVLAAIERLLDAPMDAERTAVAIEAAEKLLADDALNEGGWRALMRLHAAGGSAAKAAQAWERCRAVLREELGVAPSDATRRTFESLAPQAAKAPEARPAGTAGSTSTVLTACRDGTLPAGGVDHMLRGWQLLNEGSAHTNREARHAFESAAAQAGEAPEAVAMIGWTHLFDFTYGWSRDTAASFRSAQDCAARAMRKGAQRAAAHALLGRILLWQSRFDEARSHLERTLALAPGSAYAHSNLAELHVHGGRPDLALALVERALQIEPHDNGAFLNVMGWALLFACRPADALAAFERGAIRNPRYCQLHAGIAAACAELGDFERARRSAQRSRLNNRRLSIGFARDVLPFADPQDRQMLVSAWSLARMPECEAPYEALAEMAPPETMQVAA